MVSPDLSEAVWIKLLRVRGVLSDPLGKGVLREAPPISDSPFLPCVQYGIVLDAGSSRTTVYVYQWPAEKENNTGVVSQTCKCNVKGKAQSESGRPKGKPGSVLMFSGGLEGSREAAWTG